MKPLTVGALLLMVVVGNLLAQTPNPPVSSASKEIIDKLVLQLGSDRYREREAATRALMQMAEALPALQKAVQSGDLELQRRASHILESWHAQETKTRQTIKSLGGLVVANRNPGEPALIVDLD